MTATGKREARRPWYEDILKRALKVRNMNVNYFALSELHGHFAPVPGATRSRCSTLAPGCHMARLWRSVPTFVQSRIDAFVGQTRTRRLIKLTNQSDFD